MIMDKTGREIKRGDIVKVYHFTGARRRKYYMYKQCLGLRKIHPSHDFEMFAFSHLNFSDEVYHISPKEGMLLDYEIVQGVKDDFYDRVKQRPSPTR